MPSPFQIAGPPSNRPVSSLPPGESKPPPTRASHHPMRNPKRSMRSLLSGPERDSPEILRARPRLERKRDFLIRIGSGAEGERHAREEEDEDGGGHRDRDPTDEGIRKRRSDRERGDRDGKHGVQPRTLVACPDRTPEAPRHDPPRDERHHAERRAQGRALVHELVDAPERRDGTGDETDRGVRDLLHEARRSRACRPSSASCSARRESASFRSAPVSLEMRRKRWRTVLRCRKRSRATALRLPWRRRYESSVRTRSA